MNDVLRALAIAAGIFIPVIAFLVVISMTAVKRGEAAMHGASHDVPVDSLHIKEAATGPVAKAAAPVIEEISVLHILAFGIVLFTLTVLLLFGVSLIQHMG